MTGRLDARTPRRARVFAGTLLAAFVLVGTGCDAAAATGLLPAGVSADRSPAAPTVTTIHVALTHTVVDPATGRMWADGAGGQHWRDVAVTDDMVDAAGAQVGTLHRKISFNLQPKTGASRAWCSYSMELSASGTFTGTCSGTLLEGRFVGHGRNGATLSGTYTLGAGGTPGVGPYSLDFSISVP